MESQKNRPACKEERIEANARRRTKVIDRPACEKRRVKSEREARGKKEGKEVIAKIAKGRVIYVP